MTAPSTTPRTIASRPLGVKGPFLWTFIWSLLGTLKLRNLSFLGSEQMDNLLRDQTWPTANEKLDRSHSICHRYFPAAGHLAHVCMANVRRLTMRKFGLVVPDFRDCRTV